MVHLLDQIDFVFLMLKFLKRLFSIKGVHLDLNVFVFYLFRRVFKPLVGFPQGVTEGRPPDVLPSPTPCG